MKVENTPTLYGIVQNPGHFDDESLLPGKEDEICVTFIMSGEIEWVDTTNLNVYTTCIDDAVLNYIKGPQQLFMKDLKVVGEHRK